MLVDGAAAAKSDRVHAGAWLEVTLPPPPGDADAGGRAVPGMSIVYEDDDIVVVNKPIGVAAHPTVGWTGPTVLGGLLGAGHTIATSGAAERQGIVHRLDANTTGAMVVAKSEHAYSHLKRAFKERTVDKRYHALVQGHPDPLRGTVDAPIDRHPSGDGRWAVVAGGKPSVTHYDTIEAFRAASPARHQAGDRPHPPDPGAHVRAAPPVRRRPDVRRGPDDGRPAGRHPAVAARGLARLRASLAPASGSRSAPTTRRTCRRPWTPYERSPDPQALDAVRAES